jgi:hypothetical protein
MGLDIARQMESCVGGLHGVIDSWAADPIIDYFVRGIELNSDGLLQWNIKIKMICYRFFRRIKAYIIGDYTPRMTRSNELHTLQ